MKCLMLGEFYNFVLLVLGYIIIVYLIYVYIVRLKKEIFYFFFKYFY